MKTPIQSLKECQHSAKCNNFLYMKMIDEEIMQNPDCCVWKRVASIREQYDYDPYLTRIWVCWEFRNEGLIDTLGAIEDAVFWYEKWKSVVNKDG